MWGLQDHSTITCKYTNSEEWELKQYRMGAFPWEQNLHKYFKRLSLHSILVKLKYFGSKEFTIHCFNNQSISHFKK